MPAAPSWRQACSPSFATRLGALAAASALVLAATTPARAHGANPSEASSLSLSLPVAVSVAAPLLLAAGSAAFTIVAVEASTTGTVWVLERASDGVRASVHFAGHVAASVGTAVVVSALATGWVISAAGAALAFIPNELGRALLHNERITR
ncbi:MAG: hypothetical protein KIT17_05800 [Rubrivivax sp.]|nr:hypothetical protein [Rubrivivax sp.]